MRDFLIRGGFWLLAAVVGTHLVIALACTAFCAYYGQDIVEGRYKCDPTGRCSKILNDPLSVLHDLLSPA